MKFLISLYIIILSFPLYATKNNVIDSLKQAIATAPLDSNKVKSLIDLAWKYRNSEPKQTIFFAKQALKLAQEINYTYDVPRAMSFTGVAYQKLGDYQKAHQYYQKALEQAKEYKNYSQEAYSYHNLGVVLSWRNEYSEALTNYYKALKLFENLKDKRGVAYAYNSLSINALERNNPKEALGYANKSLEIRKELNDLRGQGVAYNRLAEINTKQGNFKTALPYLFRNVKLYKKLDDFEGLAFTTLNIARVYLYQENFTKAAYFSKKAFKYYKSLGNKGMLAQCYMLLGQANIGLKSFEKAEGYLEKAKKFAIENQLKRVELESYLHRSKALQGQGDYKEALLLHETYLEMKDSLFDMDLYKQVGRLQGNFDVFKKEQENELLKEKGLKSKLIIEKQKTQNIALFGGLILVIIFVLVLVRSNAQRRKDNKLLQVQNEHIEKQRLDITNKTNDLALAQQKLQDYSKNLEQKVVKRTTALKKSNEELELYANLASHDLKQPLRNITSFTQLLVRRLKRQDKIDETSSEYVSFIVEGTQYMNYLINELLTYSKFSKVTDDIEYETIAGKHLIKTVKKNLYQQIEESEASIIEIDVPTEIIGIKIKMIQLFQNLISNALKFRKKTGTCIICIDCTDIGEHWEFSIADNGIGIEKDYYEVIFEAFKKLHNKQTYAGVGLGLSTCKKIIEQHNGTIWVESEFGKGTTFHFTIAKSYE